MAANTFGMEGRDPADVVASVTTSRLVQSTVTDGTCAP